MAEGDGMGEFYMGGTGQKVRLGCLRGRGGWRWEQIRGCNDIARGSQCAAACHCSFNNKVNTLEQC